ncbi:MAG: hypothetical protein IPO48_05975 [Saprospiraceae bacterium]|nr:hypothetical protein [Saprospiraceae bacterium]
MRLDALELRAKSSARYKALKKQYLLPVLLKYRINITEDELALLVASESTPEVLKNLSKNRRNELIKTKSKENFNEIKLAYNALQQAYKMHSLQK